MDAIETMEYRGYTIKIHRDEHNESPRDWDNLGTMICWHSRYNLGDVQTSNPHNYYEPDQWWEENMPMKDIAAILELYLYDHGGITMRTSPFSCPWDSGGVGYIYITKEKVRKEYGKKRISKQLKARVKTYLQGEVETYDNYLTGEVYGYVVEDQGGEHVDSCWGFYGYKSGSWDYMLSEARGAVDWRIEDLEKEKREYIKRTVKAHGERVKKWIRGNVPLVYREGLSLDWEYLQG